MNYYKILGVSNDASLNDIKKAYRKLVIKHHPDKNPGKDDTYFKQIIRSYDVLKNSKKRKDYDNYIINKNKPKREFKNDVYKVNNLFNKMFYETRYDMQNYFKKMQRIIEKEVPVENNRQYVRKVEQSISYNNLKDNTTIIKEHIKMNNNGNISENSRYVFHDNNKIKVIDNINGKNKKYVYYKNSIIQ
jgi:DnaJ-class molecular chaperone